ncbi:MAG: T9SS type A sorting domain-containing protein [Candidatus Azobacteroides sp.]|nr:T9SS type A sorting domain-containing protein [Candidatus Azobacteroides sp.]
MKQKRTIWVCILIGATFFNFLPAQTGQKSNRKDRDKMFKWAYLYLNGYYTPMDHGKAYTLFERLAKEGDSQSLNALGMMYKLGKGVEQNDDKAMEYFLLAAEGGYPRASYNVGSCYRYGHSVEQDFTTAFSWFTKAMEQGDIRAGYTIGYFYYKGMGVEQDYGKALSYFLPLAEQGDAGPMFYVGLMYMKGYGVERDVEEGMSWIRKAAEKGLSRAIDFILYTENINTYGLSQVNLRSGNADPVSQLIPDQWKAVTNTPLPSERLEGEWEGKIMYYDWSGKRAESEMKIQASWHISEENRLIGSWIQDDTLSLPVKATLTDSLWIFDDTKVWRLKLVDILNGKFTIQTIGNEEFLTGNLITYCEKTRSYHPPAFVVLKKGEVVTSLTERTEKKENRVSVSPNPFEDELLVLLSLQEPQEILLEIYDMGGKKIYSSSYRKYPSGENEVIIPALSVTPGNYLLKIRGEKINESIKIIK